jgi:hypothetical protein
MNAYMTYSPLFSELARLATDRAHLAGAQVQELRHQLEALPAGHQAGHALKHAAATAWRRYWREMATVVRLMGFPCPLCDQLGGEA